MALHGLGRVVRGGGPGGERGERGERAAAVRHEPAGRRLELPKLVLRGRRDHGGAGGAPEQRKASRRVPSPVGGRRRGRRTRDDHDVASPAVRALDEDRT